MDKIDRKVCENKGMMEHLFKHLQEKLHRKVCENKGMMELNSRQCTGERIEKYVKIRV